MDDADDSFMKELAEQVVGSQASASGKKCK